MAPHTEAPVQQNVSTTSRVVIKHHPLVRLSHWLNVPLLLGMIASGLAIYWASPVFKHARTAANPRGDYLADVGNFIGHILGKSGEDAANAVYNFFSFGAGELASALAVHWLLAYLFMINGALYALGLAAGGGWRALLPRPADVRGAFLMIRYYLGLVPMLILRRPWPHPVFPSKYNALQRAAYFSMPLAGLGIVLSGWAMHKPAQLGWLERLFINYDGARIVHFTCMVIMGSFIIPHIILVIADGWDTFRSMVVGWSARVREESHE